MNFISFESNIQDWLSRLSDVERKQVPFATVMALTETAMNVRMSTCWCCPSSLTADALHAEQPEGDAGKQIHDALQRVLQDFRNTDRHYLLPQVHGGVRPIKRFEHWLIRRGLMKSDEFAVPAKGMKLNAFGNISPGVITQILSQLAAGPDATQWETKTSRKRQAQTRARYFVPRDGSKLPRGIWRRTDKRIEPVLLFVGSVSYTARYQFCEISNRVASTRMQSNFDLAMARALVTAR